jgi:F5/8 type C domain-containing protein
MQQIALYFLDDKKTIVPPESYELEYWNGSKWAVLPELVIGTGLLTGHRPYKILVGPRGPMSATKVRVTFTHAPSGKTGLTEIEVLAIRDGNESFAPAPPPKGNLAFNAAGKGFPKASASYTSRFDKVAMANDGVVSFSPSPHNRWTSYESPNASDWLEIDFGQVKQVGRVELAIFDDRGGVRAPREYTIEFWDGKAWLDVPKQKRVPETPVGGQLNEISFEKITTSKIRVVFKHRDKSRSGVSEVFIWPE